MHIPKLQQSQQKMQTISIFGGYDHNLRIPDGSFYEMKNMTSDHYPVLASREQRGRMDTARPVQAIVSSHGLCRVEDGDFHLPGDLVIGMNLTSGGKTLITMGGYVIILPDKKWINVAEAEEHIGSGEVWGSLENTWEKGSGDVTVQVCHPDGTPREDWVVATEKPAAPTDGQLWRDTSRYPAELKRWSQELGQWLTGESCCLKLSADGIGKGFYEGDTVEVTLTDPKVEIDEKTQLLRWEENALVVYGYIPTGSCKLTGEGTLKLSRKIPDMDLVFECGNRLWGCKYGIVGDKFLNEIYCSKLGDFRNWYSFQGVSTDSYVASIGADGPFTGAVAYMGRPLFFKENCMIEVYGSYPATYQVQTTLCAGVQKRCHKSLAVVNNVLYYKSRQGVCAYDGSLPVQIGSVFGSQRYYMATAGAWGSKYYICMDSGTESSLFLYDTLRGLWHREDNVYITDFVVCEDAFYGLVANTGKILNLSYCNVWNPETVDWMVETGPLGLIEPERRYVSRISLRLWLESGATATLSCRYDNQPCWEPLVSLTGTELGNISVPIRPRRCDHVRLKLEGQGPVRVYSLTKVWEEGSDVR